MCFPWFGPHSTDKSKPQHGFGRLQYWTVAGTKETGSGETVITLSLKESANSLQLWPHVFTVTAEFIIGKNLEVKLTVDNNGKEPFEYSDALHTYFNIGSIDTIALEGLQNATYYDAFGTALKTQAGKTLYFATETNRRYVHTKADCIIHDNDLKRKVSVKKSGSNVTVVWNPGEDTAKTIADMNDEGYKTFVCVEPANAYPGIDVINLAPGQSHTLSTLIEVME